jgi:hypothetical protein
MSTSGESQKKRVEATYLEEARRVSSIFPNGNAIPHEKPDFLLHTDCGTVGIEVTELCREEQRAEGGKLSKVADRAKAIYAGFANAGLVDVGAGFAPRAGKMKVSELATSLARFVYQNRNCVGSGFKQNLPEGYCHIGIHEPRNEIYPGGHWHAGGAFDVVVAAEAVLRSRIEEKNQRLPEYLISAPKIWLLIVNDQFLGHGEVYARPDDLARWKFVFDLDKVLLFSREPGGSGKVIEVQRLTEGLA